jgi:tripartite-type tricarboxylate transporter receptor subunit TctC
MKLSYARFAPGLCLLLAAAVAATAPSLAHAQARPVRILVPLPAGSTSDVVARLLADSIRDGLGRPVVIENRPGATGRIAVDAFRAAAPDGGTLLFAPIAVPVINPLVFKELRYDPARDFAPVAQVSIYEFALAVAASHPARNVAEFVAWAKADPARAMFGTPGAGSLPHFVGVMLGRAAGTDLVHVAYKGVATVEAELVGGQIAAGISATSDFIPLHRTGRLRILATSGERRSTLLQEVPTFREQGFASVVASGWHGVYAPTGTPPAVIEQLSGAIVAALRAPETRAKLVAFGLEPTGTTPRALAEIMAADAARWAPVIKASGFTAE